MVRAVRGRQWRCRGLRTKTDWRVMTAKGCGGPLTAAANVPFGNRMKPSIGAVNRVRGSHLAVELMRYRGAGNDKSLPAGMFGRSGAVGDLDDPRWKQPATSALECALAARWSSLGIRPDVVLGHRLGEIAAAHTAGAFSLEDGLHLAATRGEMVGALPSEGAMAAVFAPVSRVAEAASWRPSPAPGRRGCRCASTGSPPARHGAASRCRSIPSSASATGSRPPDGDEPGTGHPLLGARHDSASGEVELRHRAVPLRPRMARRSARQYVPAWRENPESWAMQGLDATICRTA